MPGYRPLRIGIHPNDLSLSMAGDLDRLLGQRLEPVSYSACFAA